MVDRGSTPPPEARAEWLTLLRMAEYGGPQQTPEFLRWWDGLVPGAVPGGYCILRDSSGVRAAGICYRRHNSDNTTIEYPRGPIAIDAAALVEIVGELVSLHAGEHLIVAPYGPVDHRALDALSRMGFRRLGRRWTASTVRVDLSAATEDQIFDTFRPGTRQRIRAARRHEARVVSATTEAECEWFASHATRLANEQGFEPTPLPYVLRAVFGGRPDDLGRARLFLMKVDDRPVAGALVMATDKVAHYQKGFTSRTSLGAQLLHWEAMRTLRSEGVRCYDFGGIEHDEAGTGVTRFKLGFAPSTELFPALIRHP